jgi:hypothetical protein
VIDVCEIKRGFADISIKIGVLYHAGIMLKTSQNEHYILEWGPSGGVLRKTEPNISNNTVQEEGHEWTVTECKNIKKEYDPEGIKKIMDIITYNKSYDLIGFNCQHISKFVLEALDF